MKNTELLIYMLNDIREITLSGVKGLTKEQLFTEPLPGEFPIGAYLMHLGEAELYWFSVLTGEAMPDELQKRLYYNCWFDVPEENYTPPAAPIEPEEYISAITDVRKLLFSYMEKMPDSELEEVIKVKRGADKYEEISKKWIVYHLIEHEAHTRGQMFMLMRMAGFKKKKENN